MTQPNRTETALAKRETLAAAAAVIDNVAGALAPLFGKTQSFAEELAVAQGMGELRAALTPEIMEPIMRLQNSPLGFLTDRDPKNTDREGRPLVPYSAEVVRDCFVEAKLRGFHAVGNEFNIIAGRFYAAKAGLRRKVQTFPGLSDFVDTYEVPRMVQEKGAIVKCRAAYKLNGAPCVVDREFPVKVNNYMGSDAILGKAERKLLAAVLGRLTGTSTPEGDVGDATEPAEDEARTKAAKPARATAAPTTPTVPPATSSAGAPQTAPVNVTSFAAAAAAFATEKPEPKGAEPQPPAAPEQPAATAERTTQQVLADFVTSKGYTFDHFRKACEVGRWHKSFDTWTSFDDLPAEFAGRMRKAETGLLNGLKIAAGKP